MTADRPPLSWNDDRLVKLHRTLLWQLLRFTSPPLAGGPAPLVRGILQPPVVTGTTRVVMWDGTDLATSMAYDLPLLDRQGESIPWSHLTAALRRLLGRPGAAGGTVQASPDSLGIPVADEREEVLCAVEAPLFEESDALHAAAMMFASPREEPYGTAQLSGFLLLGGGTVRLYVDEPSTLGRIGLDVSLRNGDGEVVVGNTALMAALPSLVPDELDWNRSDAQDSYCTAVYDFTHW